MGSRRNQALSSVSPRCSKERGLGLGVDPWHRHEGRLRALQSRAVCLRVRGVGVDKGSSCLDEPIVLSPLGDRRDDAGLHAGSASQQIKADNCLETAIYLKEKKKKAELGEKVVMERRKETKRVSGELESSQIPCPQPAGPTICFAVGQMAACREPRQMARGGRFASGS